MAEGVRQISLILLDNFHVNGRLTITLPMPKRLMATFQGGAVAYRQSSTAACHRSGTFSDFTHRFGGSHSRLVNNPVLKCPSALYNLANFMRTLALPEAVKQWSLTSLREKLVKIGAKVVVCP